MAAVTGVITAVAGLGLSAHQMYQQSEAQKDADKAAANAKATMKQLEEQNVMEAIQAPDVSSLAFEKIAQSEAAGLEALKGMGAVGGITAMVEQGRQAALGVAEKQAKINFDVDVMKKQNEQAIASRKYEKELGMAAGELEGAQLASADAEAKKQAATMDMVAGIGNTVTAIGQATSLNNKSGRTGEDEDDEESTDQMTKNQEMMKSQTSNMSNALSSSGMNSVYGSEVDWDEEAIKNNLLDGYLKTQINS